MSNPDKHLLNIRWMISRDIPAVLQIERESFEFPWSENDLIRSQRQHNSIGMVAENQDGMIVGFIIYLLNGKCRHLLKFAVAADQRHCGIGRQMMNRLYEKLALQGQSRLLLEVRETDLAALLFFRNCGFSLINVVKDYYEDNGGDAYLMEYWVTSEVTTPMPASAPSSILNSRSHRQNEIRVGPNNCILNEG
jgi:ribosomal-protein-alanine N-acetyltransferase